MRPSPRMPATLPSSSTPVKVDRFHLVTRSEEEARGTLRATASSSPTARSAAVTTLDVGAFTTITPARVAVSTSTLSRPTSGVRYDLRAAWANASASIMVVAHDDRDCVGERRAAATAVVRAIRVADVEVGFSCATAAGGEFLGDEDDGCRQWRWPLMTDSETTVQPGLQNVHESVMTVSSCGPAHCVAEETGMAGENGVRQARRLAPHHWILCSGAVRVIRGA